MRQFILALIVPLGLLAGASNISSPEPPDRSPIDLVVTRDGRYAVTANATSNSVSVIHLATGKVTSEQPVGRRPFAIAVSPDNQQVLVSNYLGTTVSLLTLKEGALSKADSIEVGDEPRGVAFSSDGSQAYAALSGEDSIARIDLRSRRVLSRTPVGGDPWHIALSPDGTLLVVGLNRDMTATVLDAATLRKRHNVSLRGHNVRHIAITPDGNWAYMPHISERGLGTTQQNIDFGWVVGNRISRIPLRSPGVKETATLDARSNGAADIGGCDINGTGSRIALTAAGVHEVISIRMPFPTSTSPGDHIDSELINHPEVYKRIEVGGRPTSVRFLPDGVRVVVANYLLNAVQIVNVETGKLESTIGLGGPTQPSLARQGEAMFYDADRSFNRWYSCGTCHTEGHTNHSTFDTFNDGSYNTHKKTLSLQNVTRTGPWTWHGWQKNLTDLCRDSFTRTLQGRQPSDSELSAVMAFLGTLDALPPTRRLKDMDFVRRTEKGRALFEDRGCGQCHSGPYLQSDKIVDVGLGSSQDEFKGFNPPSLLSVRTRAPYLHTGEARTLEEVLTRHHRPSKLTGRPDFDAGELVDIVSYLNSL